MPDINFYDIVTRNGNDALTGLVESVTTYAPELSQIPVIVRPGTTYRTLLRTALPTAGFRVLNQGLTPSKSTYNTTIHEMFPLDVEIEVDELAYKADDGITGDLLYQEGQGALQSAIIKIGTQTYYGQANDGSNGFVGLRSQLLSSQQNNPTATPITASNSTTSSTAYGCWLNTQGVSYAIGRQGVIDFPAFSRQQIQDSNGRKYFAWVSNISCFVGLSVVDPSSVFGITGVTQASPLTDKLGSQLIATVPLTRRAGFSWFMNRSVHQTLQASRTAINYQPASAKSGTPAWSPPPIELEGYPIVLTDSISNTENNS